MASQTPDTLGKANQEYIKRTFMGYIDPPRKVIVYVAPKEGDEDLFDALAGTPMKIAATYAPLAELTDVKRLSREEQDKAVGEGKLILVWDGRKVKLSRAVNSFVTTMEGMLDSFKKIKLVEVMDLIRTDITATAEDSYIGKYANSYDNKLLLITAIRSYFQGLERDGLVQPGYTVDIDLEAQEQYLTSKGMDISEMSERKIREADTGTYVFLLISCKLLDAIEDIEINIEI